MNDEPNESELISYIDGVLPRERRDAVEQAIAADRGLRHQLRRLVKLRATARKLLRDDAPPVPDALRGRIEVMMRDSTGKTTTLARNYVTAKPMARKSPWLYPLWRPTLAAGLAACVAIVFWLGFFTKNERVAPSQRTIVQNPTRAGLPPQFVSMVQARHLKCVMMGNNFENPTFPHVLDDVGPAVRQYLGDAVEIPDLSAINLQFAGVGPCQLKGGKTLHWLFRNPNDPKINVSVFVQSFSGQVAFDRNSAFVIAGQTEQFPMLVWRDDKFVFYLIGDDFGATSQTATKLGVGFGT